MDARALAKSQPVPTGPACYAEAYLLHDDATAKPIDGVNVYLSFRRLEIYLLILDLIVNRKGVKGGTGSVCAL